MRTVDPHSPRHALGLALGAAPDVDGSCCACCGTSPFAVGRPTAEVCGPAFTDYDLLADASAPEVCDGCARMLGGRPSREAPPLRMGHFVVLDGALLRLDGETLVELLRTMPAGVAAVGWTATRQKHASLRAGPCSSVAWEIGAETGTILWLPEHVALLDAVSVLRAHVFREHILAGQYPPHVVLGLGAAFGPAEESIAPHRHTLRLEMVVSIVCRPELIPENEPMPIATEQRAAAELLLDLVEYAPERRRDPIAFWSTLLPRRLAAAASRSSLLDAAGDLMQRLSISSPEAVISIEAMTVAEASTILRAWRDQPMLVLAVARLIRQESR